MNAKKLRKQTLFFSTFHCLILVGDVKYIFVIVFFGELLSQQCIRDNRWG